MGLVIRQSDLASFQYCAQRSKLSAQARAVGWHEPVLSATARGTVLHYAFQVLQKLIHEGREDALDVALSTFEHYWQPDYISEISPEGPVDEWIGHDTWGGLLQRSLGNLRAAASWIKRDKAVLLSLEHTFDTPIAVDGEEHTLHGTLDRLCLRMVNARPVLGIDDLKGYRRKKTHLDWATQWTVYSFASLHPNFWLPFYGTDEVAEGFAEVVDRLGARGVSLFRSPLEQDVIPRAGRLLWAWDGFEAVNVGYRDVRHYARLVVHLREYIKAVRADVYPLTVDGFVCSYCPFNHGICGDVSLPERQEGIL